MTKEEIESLIRSRSWLHGFEIAPGITSPGRVRVDAASALDYYGVPGNLSGRRALDIGARDGPYSFELERRGAEVTALDIRDPDQTGFMRACVLEWLAGTGFENASLIDPPNVEFSRIAGFARKDPAYR